MSNTRLWDKLGKTDPGQTKGFKRAGGFSGTAIKPMWSFKRMTEEFGPCGLGWGMSEPSFQVVPGSDGEVLVYCTVSVWYNDPAVSTISNGTISQHSSKSVFGVGGDKVVVKQSNGLRSDDEAFKKAYTDAIGNALKMIGVGADVHMGLFDDSKYVNEMRQEFSDTPSKAPEKPVERDNRSPAPISFNALLSSITSAQNMNDLAEAWENINGAKAEIGPRGMADLTAAKNQRKAELIAPGNNFDQIETGEVR